MTNTNVLEDKKLVLNSSKSKQCIDLLSEYFDNNPTNAEIEYPFSIKKDSEEYYTYLFYSCLLDYGMKSKYYHQNLVKTYDDYPDIFRPGFILEMNEEELLEIIKKNIHPRYPNVALKKWLHLSKYLRNFVSLKETIQEMNSSEKLDSFIKNVNGYGQKTGGLLLRTIVESNVTSFKEVHTIPIDRHDMEVCYLNGLTNKYNLNELEIKKLSKFLVVLCKEKKISPGMFDKYLWTIGNQFCSGKKCDFCPLNKTCKKKSSLT